MLNVPTIVLGAPTLSKKAFVKKEHSQPPT